MLQLEKWSHYQHLSLSGGQERPIHCCRVLDIRGTSYHVLSRLQDVGLDFTGRTNFIAHHLVFTPEEIRKFPSPAIILRDWKGWRREKWDCEPQSFENEDWSSLQDLSPCSLPSTEWGELTGDPANAFSLLDCRSGVGLRVDTLSGDQILKLFAESLDLLELRDMRRNHRASRWTYTFTTSMQEQDNPSDFRWRCLYPDNSLASRFSGPDCRSLKDLRPRGLTDQEERLARSGPSAPRFIKQLPTELKSFLGEPVRLSIVAEGVPNPDYHWYSVNRKGDKENEIPNGNKPELVVSPEKGIHRYVVQAKNSIGVATSEVVTLSIDEHPPASRVEPNNQNRRDVSGPAAGYSTGNPDSPRSSPGPRAEPPDEHDGSGSDSKSESWFVLIRNSLAVLAVAVIGFFGAFSTIRGCIAEKDEKNEARRGNSSTNAESGGGHTNREPVHDGSRTNDSAGTDKKEQSEYKSSGVVESDNQTNNEKAKSSDLTGGNYEPPARSNTKEALMDGGEESDITPWKIESVGGWNWVIKPDIQPDKDGYRIFITPPLDAKGWPDQSDKFVYVYRGFESFNQTYDFQFISPNSNSSVFGVMARQSLEDDSPFIFFGFGGGKIVMNIREVKGGVANFKEFDYKNDFKITYSGLSVGEGGDIAKCFLFGKKGFNPFLNNLPKQYRFGVSDVHFIGFAIACPNGIKSQVGFQIKPK